MGQTLLKNGYIVSMNETEQVYDGGSVLVQDDKILAVGEGGSEAGSSGRGSNRS